MSIAEKELLLKQDFDDVYEAGIAVGREDSGAYEEGKQAEYDRFWDGYQDNGNRTSYLGAFSGYGWTDETFNPKYPLENITGIHMFYYSRITDAIKDLGINIKAHSNMNNFAGNSTITHFNTVDFSEVTQCGGAFISSHLKRIERLILGEKTLFNGSFGGTNCPLEYIGFEGAVGTNGLNLSQCSKLQKECLVALLNILVDKTGTSGTWTVTLGETNLAKLTNEEKAIATDKGWILA